MVGTSKREVRRRQAEASRLLGTAVGARESAENWVRIRVRQARVAGLSWQEIGELVGLTGEGARKRYGKDRDAGWIDA